MPEHGAVSEVAHTRLRLQAVDESLDAEIQLVAKLHAAVPRRGVGLLRFLELLRRIRAQIIQLLVTQFRLVFVSKLRFFE